MVETQNDKGKVRGKKDIRWDRKKPSPTPKPKKSKKENRKGKKLEKEGADERAG